MSKDKCINEIAMVSVVKRSTHEIIKHHQLDKGSEINIHEIQISKGLNSDLHVSSTKGIMKHLHSVHPISRPDLFTRTLINNNTNIKKTSVFIEEEKYIREENGFKVKRKRKYMCTSIFQTNEVEKKSELKRNCIIGLQENERSILDIVHPLPEENQMIDEENLNDQRNKNEQFLTLEEYLHSEQSSILQNILNELRNSNIDKWSAKLIEDLYPGLLTMGTTLMEEGTVKELNIVCMELHCFTSQNWASSNMVKAEIVNSIVKAFSGVNTVEVECRKRKVFNPESLITYCVNYIKSNEFPKEHIQIPIASLWQIQNKNNWYNNTTIPMHCYMPSDGKTKVETIEFFSYPEYSIKRNQLEFRTFDFTHILTNLRTQILTRGFDYCKKEHFKYFSLKKPGLLSLALVFEKTDQQNAFTAMQMFNYDVECFMRENKFEETAEFICLVRNWHDACNRHGLCADTRVKYLTEMHKFLTEGINFNSVPFQYPGRYIKGITWQT